MITLVMCFHDWPFYNIMFPSGEKNAHIKKGTIGSNYQATGLLLPLLVLLLIKMRPTAVLVLVVSTIY